MPIAFYTGGKLLTGRLVENNPSNVHRTTFESGEEKQVARTGRHKTIRRVTYVFTNSEYVAFKTWFHTTAKQGALFFSWLDPVDDVTKDARIVNGEYNGTAASALLTHWFVDFEIETYG